MTDSSRRGFLTVMGVGAAAGAATIAVPASASAETVSLPDSAEGSMAAYIHDVKRGELTIMVEGQQTIVTDHKLVALLAHAFAHAAKD